MLALCGCRPLRHGRCARSASHAERGLLPRVLGALLLAVNAGR
jgi:hypothetical protein